MTAAGRVLPSLAERRLSARLTALDGEISALYAQLRTAQLGVSSVTGALPIRDSAGVLTGIVGVQPDGSTAVTVQNASPPPQPNAPDLAPFAAGLRVSWNGDFPFASRPANFRNVEVYLGTSPAFIPGPSNFVGTLGEAGSIPVAPLPYVPHYAVLIAVNNAEPAATVGTGIRSTASQPSLPSAAGVPTQVVADAVLAGIIDNLALADDAVNSRTLADAAVSGNHVVAASLTGNLLVAQTIYGGLIATDTLDARTIGALSISADALQANAVTAGAIDAGSVTAAKLAGELVLASRVVVGDPIGNRLELHPIDGLQGVYNGQRTLWFDVATGNLLAIGQWSTGTVGERFVMLTDGTMRLYPGSGSNYSEIANYNANIGMRGPLNAADGNRSGFLNVTATGARLGYGTATGAVSSMFSFLDVGSTFTNLRGSFIGNRIDNTRENTDASDQRWMLCHTNATDGADDSWTYVHYYRIPGAGPHGMEASLDFSQGACGIRGSDNWGGGLYVGRLNNTAAPIVASNVAAPSGREVKTRVRPLGRGRDDVFAAMRRAKVSRFRYRTVGDPVDDDDPDGPVVPPLNRVVGHRRRVPGSPDDAPEFVEEPMVLPEPGPEPEALFPMAEDLELVDDVLVQTGADGGKIVGLRDTIGFLWHIITEMLDAREDIQSVATHALKVPLVEPAESGFFESGGTLYYKNTLGQTRKVV